MPDTEPGKELSTKLNRISEIAKQDPKIRFTSLAHLLSEEYLKECYGELNRQAVTGIDRINYAVYGKNLEENMRTTSDGTPWNPTKQEASFELVKEIFLLLIQ